MIDANWTIGHTEPPAGFTRIYRRSYLIASYNTVNYVEIPNYYQILFKLYSEYLNKEALDGLGDFKMRGQLTQTVKYAYDLVLMAIEETILHDMNDKLIEIGRCYGMEMNVDETKEMRITRQPFPVTIMIDQKQLENVVCSKY